MECRCEELNKYREERGKLWNASVIMKDLGTWSQIVQYQCGRTGDGTENTYDSTRKYMIIQNLESRRSHMQAKDSNIDARIQAASTELSYKILCMEREDEQYHIEESLRRREEEKRKRQKEQAKEE